MWFPLNGDQGSTCFGKSIGTAVWMKRSTLLLVLEGVHHRAMRRLTWAIVLVIAATTSARGDFVEGPMPAPVAAPLGERTQLAQQGDATAQYALGLLYEEGDAVTKDLAEAAWWYTKAAAQDHARAQLRLGLMYAKGHGVGQDFARALRWFLGAALKGDAAAQNNLGWMYYNGLGVPTDNREAARWFRRAAEQGEPEAQNNLGWLYMYGRGVPRDLSGAEDWLRRAAEGGEERTARLARANLDELVRIRKTAPADSEIREMGSVPRAPVETVPLAPSLAAEAASGTGLTIRITETPQVSQPPPFAMSGETVIVPRTRIEVEEGGAATFVILGRGETDEALTRELDALQLAPGDLAAVLEALRTAGALAADVEVK